MESKRFAMELEVAPRVLKAPGWHLCLSYEQKVREAAVGRIRMQCLPLAEALERVRNDQEHRMIRGSSLQQSALRHQSAHEQSRQACIHGETSRLPQEGKVGTGLALREAQRSRLLEEMAARANREAVSRLKDLLKHHRHKFVLKRDGQELCY